MTLKQRILSVLMNPSIAFLDFCDRHAGYLCRIQPSRSNSFPASSDSLPFCFRSIRWTCCPCGRLAVVLILAAFAMFILEAKIQSHGIVGAGGILLMVLGALLLVDGPIPQMRVQLWAALAVAIPMGLITVFLMSMALKATKK